MFLGTTVGIFGESYFVQADVRFSGDEVNAAADAWEKLKDAASNDEGAVVFKGLPLTAVVLDGEEEEQYWAKFKEQLDERKKASSAFSF